MFPNIHYHGKILHSHQKEWGIIYILISTDLQDMLLHEKSIEQGGDFNLLEFYSS